MANFRAMASFFRDRLFVSARRLPLLLLILMLVGETTARADLAEVKKRGVIRFGADVEQGGPYIFQDRTDPNKFVGFEVDLASALARELGVKAELFAGSWPSLLLNADRGDCDIVLNDYEYTQERAASYLASYPYYIYEVNLMARKEDDRVRFWSSLLSPPPGTRFKVGALAASPSADYVRRAFGRTCDVLEYESSTHAMTLTSAGKLDACVQDSCVAQYYLENRKRFQKLESIGKPRSPGYYVIYAPPGNDALIGAINDALQRLHESGELKAIYERYGVWNDTQDELPEVWHNWYSDPVSPGPTWYEAVTARLPRFLWAALTTIMLACCAMPIASFAGLLLALLRIRKSATGLPTLVPETVLGIPTGFIRWPFEIYVEIVRGTPLIFQLYMLIFLLPAIGIDLPPFWAGVIALSIDYSAYESENFRISLQEIPKGQMEAAMALGMSKSMALRRIIIPQAFRMVIPNSASVFIAMFKDTSICSVIAVTELSREFTIAYTATDQFFAMAAITCGLYLIMSIPLSRLAAYLERKLTPGG